METELFEAVDEIRLFSKQYFVKEKDIIDTLKKMRIKFENV